MRRALLFCALLVGASPAAAQDAPEDAALEPSAEAAPAADKLAEAQALVNTAVVHFRAKEYDAALKALLEAEVLAVAANDPGLASIRFNIARCLEELERWPEALAAYETYLKLPDDSHRKARAWKAVGALEERVFGRLDVACDPPEARASLAERPKGEAGTVDEETGNTVECRIEHAQRAADNADECVTASESGGEFCISQECVEYCDLIESKCPNAYPSRAHCAHMCAAYPRGAATDGNNTLECRLRHARSGRCDAAHTNGGGVCGEVCEMYCSLHQLNCSGVESVYDSVALCRNTCAVLDQSGDHGDWRTEVEGDTVQCRTYHFGQPASEFPDVHCDHGTVYDTTHCGKDPCEVFCDLAERNCAGGIGSRQLCTRACGLLGDNLPVPGLDPVDCDGLR